jgi:hypothetical protein
MAKRTLGNRTRAAGRARSIVERLDAKAAGPTASAPLGEPAVMVALRRQLVASLKSSGGRPALEGTDRRQKIPMSDADWAKVEQIARTFAADGVHVTAGQVASQLLHDAIARVAESTPYPKPVTPNAKLPVAESVETGWGHSAAGPAASAVVELPSVALELRCTSGQRWTVHSITLRSPQPEPRRTLPRGRRR